MTDSLLVEKFTATEFFENFTKVEDKMLEVIQLLGVEREKNKALKLENKQLLQDREESNKRLEDLLSILSEVKDYSEYTKENQATSSITSHTSMDNIATKPVLMQGG